MSDHRANLEQNLAHFMTHTKSSAPKFSTEMRTIVPTLSATFVGEGGDKSQGAPIRSSSQREARARDFGGGAAASALRGYDADNSSPFRRGSDTPTRGRSNTPRSNSFTLRSENTLRTEGSGSLGGTRRRDELSDSLRPERSLGLNRSVARNGSPSREASGVVRSGRSNLQTASILGPEPENPAVGGSDARLWVQRPLSNGSRYLPKKRRYDSPVRDSSVRIGTFDDQQSVGSRQSASRAESPRAGKKQIFRAPNIEGCDMHVLTEPKPVTPHRAGNKFYKSDPPYLVKYADGEMAGGDFATAGKNLAEKPGLMGYGPTGKRKIQVDGQGMGILDHPQPRSASEARALTPPRREAPRGKQEIPGKSHESVCTWDLKSYSAEQLNERKWRPSTVVMHGPQPFVVPSSPRREPRGISSPGRRRIDPGNSNIFPLPNEVPVLKSPHLSMTPPRGRSPGRYSPLRQAPPSSFPSGP